MKTNLSRLVCLALSILLVCSMLPFAALAAEEPAPVQMHGSHSARTLGSVSTDQWGNTKFTTFADLKKLANKTYSEFTYVYCEKDLKITENLTIPENLYVDLYGSTSVASGVTLTLSEGSNFDTSDLTVNGTIISSTVLFVYGDLTVNGRIDANGDIVLAPNSALTGESKINFGEYWGICISGYVENVDGLLRCINKAVANPSYDYNISIYEGTHITLNQSVTIPKNLDIYLEYGSSLTVAPSCTLTNNGWLTIYSPLTINGTLYNTGNIFVGGWYSDYYSRWENGVLILNAGSSYMGKGSISVEGGSRTSLQECVPGLNLNNFTVYEDTYDSELHWSLWPETGSFVDVFAGDYFYQPVEWAVSRGVTTGLSAELFGPGQACTRGQVVTFLWRAAGQPEPKNSTNPFTDVKESDYFYKAVLWAVENGITAGYGSASIFNPDGICTRGQVVTFLWRAQGQPAPAVSANPFSDVKDTDYFATAVLWALEKNVTTGLTATTFGPDSDCTRGQVVTFLYRAQ